MGSPFSQSPGTLHDQALSVGAHSFGSKPATRSISRSATNAIITDPTIFKSFFIPAPINGAKLNIVLTCGQGCASWMSVAHDMSGGISK